jgi:hypothetical protein
MEYRRGSEIMGWYGSMSGLGHEPPTFEEFLSSQNPPLEEGSPEYITNRMLFSPAFYEQRTKTFHFDTNPHPWVAHHKSIPGYIDAVTENGELGIYKNMATYPKEELTVMLREAGKTDYQINNWFRTGKWGSAEPSGLSDLVGFLLIFFVGPTIIWNLPASVPLSPRWFEKKML